jgi:hypothetical protein
MKEASDREELMIRYLLGQLPEEEQVRIEEQFFTDEESYEQLLALEDELRYDYATGELAGRERERFKERFLVTPEDRNKVAFASELISKVAPSEASATAEVTATPSGYSPWWQQLASLLNVQNPVVRYSFAAAVLVVALGAAWLISKQFRSDGPTEMAGREQQPQQQTGQRDGQTNDAPVSVPTPPKEVVVEQRPPQPSPSREPEKRDEPSVPSIATFLLTPGLIRDAGEPRQLVIEGNTNRVRLQLSLKRKSEHPGYRAVLRTLEGVEVWNRIGLSARREGAGQAVTAQLPTRLLAGGDYELVLQGATPSGDYEDVDEYYFRIVKK